MTAAVILGAGVGRRMGGPKALLNLDGETLLHRAARLALAAGCMPVVAVVGEWEPGLEDLPVQIAVNSAAAEGMASSIRLGIAALSPEVQAVLLLTVDQPEVTAGLLANLLALAALAPEQPAACTYSGTLGIPAILPRLFFPDLLALQGDRGAKGILLKADTTTLAFPGGAQDLDTPQDLLRR